MNPDKIPELVGEITFYVLALVAVLYFIFKKKKT